MNDSESFVENMSLFLRNSPLVHRSAPKCEECVRGHRIFDSRGTEVIYCKFCNHPIESQPEVPEHSQVIVRKPESIPAKMIALFRKAM